MFDKTQKTVINIEGMMCTHCVKRVTDTLKALKGVKSVEVSLENKNAEIEYVSAKITVREIAKKIEDAGYKVTNG